MSYYKTINGVKYEKSLLDLADQISQGQGDGRISESDLQQLTTAVCDGQSITEIERKTLKYILDNYSITDAAKDWYRNNMPVIVDDRDFTGHAYYLLRPYKVDWMELKIDPRVVEEMHCKLTGSVNFFQAFKEAVEIFLTDPKRNAPLGEVEGIVDHYLGINKNDLKNDSKWPGVVLAFLKERMNAGYLELLPDWEELPFEVADAINKPDIDVSPKDYWIFFLGIRTDDHQFFAMVDRKGEKDTFIYGYN